MIGSRRAHSTVQSTTVASSVEPCPPTSMPSAPRSSSMRARATASAGVATIESRCLESGLALTTP